MYNLPWVRTVAKAFKTPVSKNLECSLLVNGEKKSTAPKESSTNYRDSGKNNVSSRLSLQEHVKIPVFPCLTLVAAGEEEAQERLTVW